MCSRAERLVGQVHTVLRREEQAISSSAGSSAADPSPNPSSAALPCPWWHPYHFKAGRPFQKPATLTTPEAIQTPLPLLLAAGHWPQLRRPSPDSEVTFPGCRARKPCTVETTCSLCLLLPVLRLLAGFKHHLGHHSSYGMGQARFTHWVPKSASCLLAVPKSPVARPLSPHAGPHGHFL